MEGCVRIMGGLSEDPGRIGGGSWEDCGLWGDCGRIVGGLVSEDFGRIVGRWWEHSGRNLEGLWED